MKQGNLAKLVGDWNGESLTQRVLICEQIGLNCYTCGRKCPLSETNNQNKEIEEDVVRPNV